MWVMTPRGFYSVVQKGEDRDDDLLVVRTRNRADIDALKDLIPKVRPYRVKGYSDYAWRIKVTREQWEGALLAMAREVDYHNFKDEVTRRQGRKRHDVYLRVWTVLLSLSDPTPRSRRRKRAAGTREFVDEGPFDGGTDYGHMSSAEFDRLFR